MVKQHGYITDDIEELATSYKIMKNLIAFKDLQLHLEQMKSKAMSALKQNEDSEARATWQMIDKIFSRIEYVEREAKLKEKT